MFHKMQYWQYLINDGSFGWKQASADSKNFEMINHFKRNLVTLHNHQKNSGAQYGHIRCSWWRKKMSSQSIGLRRIRPLDPLELTVHPWKSKSWKMKPSYVGAISADFSGETNCANWFQEVQKQTSRLDSNHSPYYFFPVRSSPTKIQWYSDGFLGFVKPQENQKTAWNQWQLTGNPETKLPCLLSHHHFKDPHHSPQKWQQQLSHEKKNWPYFPLNLGWLL